MEITDREKVIKGLEVCVDRVPGKYTCNECPYEIDGNYCEINLAKDALALLKKQEAQKFLVDESGKITPLPIVFPNCPLKAQETVVRCKDCEWSKPEKVFKNVPTSKDMVRWCELITRYVDDDWFCADGVKRDNK